MASELPTEPGFWQRNNGSTERNEFWYSDGRVLWPLGQAHDLEDMAVGGWMRTPNQPVAGCEDSHRRLRNEVSDCCANILTDTPEAFGKMVKESPERLLDLVTSKVDSLKAKIASLTELLRGAEYYIKPLAQNELLRANIAAELSRK